MGILSLEDGVTHDELIHEKFVKRWYNVYVYEHYIQFNGRMREVFKIFYWPDSAEEHIRNKSIVRYSDRYWNSKPKIHDIEDIGDLIMLKKLAIEGKAED